MFFTFSTKIKNPPTTIHKSVVVPKPIIIKPFFVSNDKKCSNCGK